VLCLWGQVLSCCGARGQVATKGHQRAWQALGKVLQSLEGAACLTTLKNLQMLCSIACQPCTGQCCVTAAMCAWKPNEIRALTYQLVISVSVCCAGGCAASLPRASRAANSLHGASAGPQQQPSAAADRLASSK
jgi:hypothetical protein